jgi:hypothetical protein
MQTLDIPVTIKDWKTFEKYFYQILHDHGDDYNPYMDVEKRRKHNGVLFERRKFRNLLDHFSVAHLKNADGWHIVSNSATPGYVGIAPAGNRAFLHCPEELLLRVNPPSPRQTGG